MYRPFIDLHVHSKDSIGTEDRFVISERARELGLSISFCDGQEAGEGHFISFSKKHELKEALKKAKFPLYNILVPRSNDAFKQALTIKPSIIETILSPTRAKFMATKGSWLEFPLTPLYGTRGLERVKVLRKIDKNLKYARKYRVPFIITSMARSSYDLRTTHQIHALLRTLGFTREEILNGTYIEPEKIREEMAHRIEGRFISEHVRLA